MCACVFMLFCITAFRSGITPFRSIASEAAYETQGALISFYKTYMERHAQIETQLKGKANADAVRQLKVDKFKIQQDLLQLDAYMLRIFEGVLMHRYRDIQTDLRSLSITHLCKWIAALPSVFLKDQYLKYLGWNLSDKEPAVRISALTGLLSLLGDRSNLPGLDVFCHRFLERILEMTKDVDVTVAPVAIQVVTEFLRLRWLGEKDGDSLPDCLFHGSAEVRDKAAIFVYEDYFYDANEPLPLPEQVNQVLSLLETAAPPGADLEIATQHLVSSLWPHVPVLRHWDVLYQCMVSAASSASGKASVAAGAVQLDEKRVTHLAYVLMAAAEFCMPGVAEPKDMPNFEVKSKKPSADQVEAAKSFSIFFAKHLVSLLRPFQTDVNKLNALLHLPRYLDLTVFSTQRLQPSFEELMTLLTGLFTKSTEPVVLNHTCRALVHLAYGPAHDYQEDAVGAVAELAHNLNKRLAAALDSKTGTPDERAVEVAIAIKRVHTLSIRVHNEKALDYSSQLDRYLQQLLDIMLEKRLNATQTEIVLSCLEMSTASVMWHMNELLRIKRNRDAADAAVDPIEDADAAKADSDADDAEELGTSRAKRAKSAAGAKKKSAAQDKREKEEADWEKKLTVILTAITERTRTLCAQFQIVLAHGHGTLLFRAVQLSADISLLFGHHATIPEFVSVITDEFRKDFAETFAILLTETIAGVSKNRKDPQSTTQGYFDVLITAAAKLTKFDADFMPTADGYNRATIPGLFLSVARTWSDDKKEQRDELVTQLLRETVGDIKKRSWPLFMEAINIAAIVVFEEEQSEDSVRDLMKRLLPFLGVTFKGSIVPLFRGIFDYVFQGTVAELPPRLGLLDAALAPFVSRATAVDRVAVLKLFAARRNAVAQASQRVAPADRDQFMKLNDFATLLELAAAGIKKPKSKKAASKKSRASTESAREAAEAMSESSMSDSAATPAPAVSSKTTASHGKSREPAPLSVGSPSALGKRKAQPLPPPVSVQEEEEEEEAEDVVEDEIEDAEEEEAPPPSKARPSRFQSVLPASTAESESRDEPIEDDDADDDALLSKAVLPKGRAAAPAAKSPGKTQTTQPSQSR
jgi:hypothetical protein